MTTLPQCRYCLDGIFRDDPQTGDVRCGGCGSRADMDPPVVMGGQGRDADEVVSTSDSLGVAVVAALVLLAFACGWMLRGGS